MTEIWNNLEKEEKERERETVREGESDFSQ